MGPYKQWIYALIRDFVSNKFIKQEGHLSLYLHTKKNTKLSSLSCLNTKENERPLLTTSLIQTHKLPKSTYCEEDRVLKIRYQKPN